MEEEYVQSEDNKVTKEPETNYHYSGSKTKDFYSYIEGSQSKEGESVSYTNTQPSSRIQDFYNFIGNNNKNQEAGFFRDFARQKLNIQSNAQPLGPRAHPWLRALVCLVLPPPS